MLKNMCNYCMSDRLTPSSFTLLLMLRKYTWLRECFLQICSNVSAVQLKESLIHFLYDINI